MKVPFFNFNNVLAEIKTDWLNGIENVIDSGQYIGGPAVTKFEKKYADYSNADYCVGVANGLDAITLSLKALDLPKSSLVAVPAHTFIATWLAVDQAGHIPVGIDVDQNGLIDLESLESESLSISAVIPVHLHGQTVDMPRIINWAKTNNIRIIEDCAQAHGAELGGKKVGTWGDLGAFSFYPTKNLGALGDAGGVLTNSGILADRVRTLANYGAIKDNKYTYSDLGVNSRLDPIQASVLNANLPYLDSWNTRRKANSRRYIENLKDLNLKIMGDEKSVWHHFAILVENREKLRERLKSLGIGTEIHYPNLASTAYSGLKHTKKQEFRNAEFISRSILSLPMSPWLTEQEIDYVCESLLELSKEFNFQIGM